MRAYLLAIGCSVLAACIGNIGGGIEGTEATPTTFGCDPESAELTATPIKRLAKAYLQHALEEFLSPLSESSRAAVIDALETRLQLIPLDDSEHYAQNDDKLSQDHVDAVFGLSMALATKLTSDPIYVSELLSVCGTPSLEDDACLTEFVEYYGRKSFRRPLTGEEIADFKSFYQQAVGQGVDGIAALVGRLIAHPRFYYRFDADGELLGGSEGADAVYRLNRWELLSKVTFLFWASPPNDALYDFVEGTDITDDGALSSLIDQVLADPRAERGVLSFYREWLELEDTLNPQTDGNLAATEALVAAAGIEALPETHRDDMIQEVLDLTKHYSLTTEGSLQDILVSPYSFAKTPALAAIYGVDTWDGGDLVPLPAGRTSLLTRAAFVASNAEYTRPIIKGQRVRTRLLCTPVPRPPPDLEIKPLLHPPDKTTRQAVEEATADPRCQACHGTFNDFGFASENFDPLGRLRDKELRFAEGSGEIIAELDLDTRVDVTLYEGESREIADTVELSAYLAESGVVHKCMVQNYFEFVNGRVADDQTDGCDLEELRTDLTSGSIKSMLKTSVMQQSFRQRKVN